MNDEIRGFAGLGMQVVLEEGVVKVVSPIDDTPAFRAGIQSGDLVIAIDGEQVFGLTLEQAVAKLRRPNWHKSDHYHKKTSTRTVRFIIDSGKNYPKKRSF